MSPGAKVLAQGSDCGLNICLKRTHRNERSARDFVSGPRLPRRFGMLRVVLEACAQSADYFRAGFAQRPELRFVDPLDVFAEVVANLR